MATNVASPTLLCALSPLDGRYRSEAEPLADYFSEGALIRYRVLVEVEYLIALRAALGQGDEPEAARLRSIHAQLTPADLAAIKEQERITRHDVKAVEYFLRQRVGPLAEQVHLGLTSEDVNNLAYGCMLRDAGSNVVLPGLLRLFRALRDLAAMTGEIPMMALTHGQPASPTTLGKELAVYLERLGPVIRQLHDYRLTGKLNGATGTFAALALAYPKVNWPAFSERFVTGLGLEPNMVTTQVEPHDRLAGWCDTLRRAHNILLDLCQDLWHYVSRGYFRLVAVSTEVGSSTMPHKVNPIDFENAEGNLGLADAMLVFFSEKLTRSRLQRDLSDSTVMRNLGVALGHGLLAYSSLARGLAKVEPQPDQLQSDLDAHPEVLAEAYQVVLRSVGRAAPYEQLKDLTRGHGVTLDAMRSFVNTLDLDEATRSRLLALSPAGYVGLAPRLATQVVHRADGILAQLESGVSS